MVLRPVLKLASGKVCAQVFRAPGTTKDWEITELIPGHGALGGL